MIIHNADCREVEWGDYDCLITDPPYRAAVHAKATSQSRGGGARHRDLGFEHLSEELMEYTADLAAGAKRWSVIFSDLESIGAWQEMLDVRGATYIRTIPWVRWSMPQLSGDRPPQGAEAVIIAYGYGDGRKHWNGPGNLTHFDHTCLRGDGKHKAEKPLDLMLELVEYFSDEHELVIDPFAGSGTTGAACKGLNRRFVGAEMNEEWAAKGNERLTRFPFNERDKKRYDIYVDRYRTRLGDMERMKSHTAKVRVKL